MTASGRPDNGHDEGRGRYGEHPDTVHDGLRLVADWMDEADRLISRAFQAAGQQRRNEGDQVQQDMRRLADWFAAHLEAAQSAWAYVKREHDIDAEPCPVTSHGDDGGWHCATVGPHGDGQHTNAAGDATW